jgi:hypothetical protein
VLVIVVVMVTAYVLACRIFVLGILGMRRRRRGRRRNGAVSWAWYGGSG